MFSAQRISTTGLLTLAALSWTSSNAFAGTLGASATSAVDVMPATVFVSIERLPTVAPATVSRRGPFGSQPIDAAALASRRGGDGVINEAQLKGVVANNSAVNVQTGSNSISDGAFAGSAGLSTVVQNSGNNVLIQNSTIVNLQLK